MFVYHQFPPNLSAEERAIFLHKVGPCTLVKGILLRIGPDQKLKRCLEGKEIPVITAALHAEEFGGHYVVNTSVIKIREAGYWWPTMHHDAYNYIKQCDPYQLLCNSFHCISL